MPPKKPPPPAAEEPEWVWIFRISRYDGPTLSRKASSSAAAFGNSFAHSAVKY